MFQNYIDQESGETPYGFRLSSHSHLLILNFMQGGCVFHFIRFGSSWPESNHLQSIPLTQVEVLSTE